MKELAIAVQAPRVNTQEPKPDNDTGGFQVDGKYLRLHGKESTTKVSMAMKIVASGADEDGNGRQYEVHYRDVDGKERREFVDLDIRLGEPSVLAKFFEERGGKVFEPPLLKKYFSSAEPTGRFVLVRQPGWHSEHVFVASDGEVYVRTDERGQQSPRAILSMADGATSKLRMGGMFEGWQGEISKYAVGNSRMLFAMSAAFAGPLLEPAAMQGGGINFKGPSTVGKTTIVRAAGSVFGITSESAPARDRLVHGWDNTPNALKCLASSHNAATLFLDELGTSDAKRIGDVVYALANGTDRGRLDRNGQMKATRGWNMVFVSTGEVGLTQHMAEAGKTPRDGQLVRFSDIEADTGVFGLFEVLHGFEDGKALSQHIGTAAATHYGHAWRMWLGYIANVGQTTLLERVNGMVKEFLLHAKETHGDLPATVSRSLSLFALIATAGELATEGGITGWPHGEAKRGTLACLDSWITSRAAVGEKEQCLHHARHLFATQSARFQRWRCHGWQGDEPEGLRANFPEVVRDQLGWKRTLVSEAGVELPGDYIMDPVVFREQFGRWTSADKWMRAEGWLKTDSDGRRFTKSMKHPETNAKVRLYVFDMAKMHEGENLED